MLLPMVLLGPLSAPAEPNTVCFSFAVDRDVAPIPFETEAGTDAGTAADDLYSVLPFSGDGLLTGRFGVGSWSGSLAPKQHSELIPSLWNKFWFDTWMGGNSSWPNVGTRKYQEHYRDPFLQEWWC